MKYPHAMKKLSVFLIAFTALCAVQAQTQEPYEFKEFKKLTCTPVKSQDQTGTCWAFSAASFLESEALRLGKGQQNLSEMFVVRNIYHQKCENYVRRQGHAQFSQGGLAHDLLNAVKQYGIVPEDAYPGRKDDKPFNHSRLEKNLKSLCDDFVKQGLDGSLKENWLTQIDSLLDLELGAAPKQIKVNGLTMDPKAFRDFLSLNADNYVHLTSFTHHPFYSNFILEVPDNFSNGSFFNLPISDLMRCLNFAIQNGYTVEWDADVSNPGFSAQNGLALEPSASWKDKNREQQASTFKYWEPERNITQEYRQQLFDRQVTTDDHLMHIIGIVDEKHSGVYYVVKNSWGEISDYKGFVNVSEAYMRANTISFTIHKDALPTDIRRRMSLEPGEVNIENNGSPLPNNRRPNANNPSDPKQVPMGKIEKTNMDKIAPKQAPKSKN
jgi:bleomycin hydrolase